MNESSKSGGVLKRVSIVAIIALGVVSVLGYVAFTNKASEEGTNETEIAVSEEAAAPAKKLSDVPENNTKPAKSPQDEVRAKALIQSIALATQKTPEQAPSEKAKTIEKLEVVMGGIEDDPDKRAKLIEVLKQLQEADAENAEQMSLEELLSHLETADLGS